MRPASAQKASTGTADERNPQTITHVAFSDRPAEHSLRDRKLDVTECQREVGKRRELREARKRTKPFAFEFQVRSAYFRLPYDSGRGEPIILPLMTIIAPHQTVSSSFDQWAKIGPGLSREPSMANIGRPWNRDRGD